MLTPIPARDIAPGDVLAIAAGTPGRVQVRDVATIDGRTYVLERFAGEIVPTAYTLPADALVGRYNAH